jgi:hypothetical protein
LLPASSGATGRELSGIATVLERDSSPRDVSAILTPHGSANAGKFKKGTRHRSRQRESGVPTMTLFPRAYSETILFIVQSIGKLIVGVEIGGTGQKRKDYSKKVSRSERRATGTVDQAQQHKEVMAGSLLLGVLFFLAMYGLFKAATAAPTTRNGR